MRKKITLLVLILMFSGIIFISCKKEYFDMDKMRTEQWQNVNMQVPLINTTLVLRDILRDYDHEELFEIDDDGFLSLIYNNTAFSKYAKDVIVLDDVVLPTDNLSGDQITGSNITLNKNFNFSSFPGAQLDSIKYDSVIVEVTVSNNMSTEGALTIQFPGLKRNGVMAQLFISNVNGTTTHLYTGYELDLATGGPNNIDYNYILDGWNGSAAQSVDVTISIKNQDYKIINGYIGKHSLDLPQDSVLINIFKSEFEGQFYFQDPKIKLTMINSFGLPISAALDTIYGQDYDDNLSPYYTLGFEKNPVNYPTVKGEYAEDEAIFDTTNAIWIRDFIVTKPKYIYFDGLGEINPSGNIDHSNFVLDTSIFKLNFEFELPLWGRAEYPTLTDTTELDMSKQYENLNDITYLKFRFDINNGMATEIRVQAYFIDTLGIIQDSLFMNKEDWILVDGGITNADGKVVQKTRKISEIVYDRNKINKLETVSDIIYVAEIRTDNIEQGKLVKFYADDSVDIKMGIHVKGGTDLDFDSYQEDTTSSN